MRFSSLRRMVSSSTTSSSTLFWMRSMAGPDNTAWVAQATTLLAPISLMALAAPHRVPAVSIMSSMMMTSRSFTSPMMFITSETFARGRRLSTMARGRPRRSAKVRARVTEPRSGETTMKLRSFSSAIFFSKYGARMGMPSMWSTGTSKKP
ncbi:hypothetical protein SDC9_159994 [bioreactor metagenome]|uniref:Uncharacterized protein n=1 Tax=bioreactor metagenome TaxID=1076179 RepID=A0A645FE49_9ZZZZ